MAVHDYEVLIWQASQENLLPICQIYCRASELPSLKGAVVKVSGLLKGYALHTFIFITVAIFT